MSPNTTTATIALAAQMIELGGSAPTTIRMLPAGRFRAKDGRPQGLPGWHLDDASAAQVIASAKAQQDQFLIDYEHQTLYSKQNGAKAPAAGWFSALEWRPGDGLYATDVEWTDAAKLAIQAKEYRYISPVLTFDHKNGAVTGLLMAALVNHPALDGLTDLAAAHFQPTRRLPRMNPELLKLLALPDSADEAAVLDAVTALQTQAVSAQTQLAALAAQTPDPAQYAPVSALAALQTELAALTAKVREDELEKLIAPALADGRLLPAQKEWAEMLGRKDIASLSAYLATAQPLAALSSTQTGGHAPPDAKPPLTTLDPNAIYTARRAVA